MGEIKQLTIEDAPALQEISIETYTDTFGPYNTPENMQAYLVEAYNLEKLQKELANPHSDFYFIFVDNQLAGYMKLNRERAQTEPMGPEKLEVERLYILPAFKGKKLGTQLLELAEEKAREFGKNALWLVSGNTMMRRGHFIKRLATAITVNIHFLWETMNRRILFC